MPLELPTVAELLARQEQNLKVYSTGCLWLDLAIEQQDPKTGLFGIPHRTIIEAYGPQRTGKTLLGESLAKSVLDADPENEVIFLLAEEPNYARMRDKGLDINRIRAWTFRQDDEVLKDNPESFITVESGMNMILASIRRGRRVLEYEKDGKTPKVRRITKFVMIDSVSALVSETDVRSEKTVKEVEGTDMPGIRAKLMQKFLRLWTTMNNSDAILFMTNHYSEPIQMPGKYPAVGSDFKAATPGGRFMEYLSFIRIRCDSTKLECDQENPFSGTNDTCGMELFYTVKTNKFGTSTLNRRAVTEFIFEKGCYKKEKELITLGAGLDIITQGGGGWFNFGKDKDGNDIKVQGKESAEQYLIDNPKLALDIEKKIIAQRAKIFKTEGKIGKPSLRAKAKLDKK